MGMTQVQPRTLAGASRSSTGTDQNDKVRSRRKPLLRHPVPSIIRSIKDKAMGKSTKRKRGRPRKFAPVIQIRKPRCVHAKMVKNKRGRPKKCKLCLSKGKLLNKENGNSLEKDILLKNGQDRIRSKKKSMEDCPEKHSVIRIAGPDSSIFKSYEKDSSACNIKSNDSNESSPVVLFPYRKDPCIQGNLLIVDDYKSIDGVMTVPLQKTKEFDSRLDNCDPVLSGIMFSNLYNHTNPAPDVEMAIRNSYHFVNYLDEQSDNIISLMNEIVPLEYDLDASENLVPYENNLDPTEGNESNNLDLDATAVININDLDTTAVIDSNDLDATVVIQSPVCEIDLNPTMVENSVSHKNCSDAKTKLLLTIKLVQVRAVDAVSATFKIKGVSILQETFIDYCQNFLRCSVNDVYFFYKNRLVQHDATAKSLNIEEGDIIRCYDAHFVETYTVKCLVPFMERHGLTAEPGSFIEELLNVSPSFPEGLKSIKDRQINLGSAKFLASLSGEDFNNQMNRLLSVSRRK